jgi:hypothetical protein
LAAPLGTLTIFLVLVSTQLPEVKTVGVPAALVFLFDMLIR